MKVNPGSIEGRVLAFVNEQNRPLNAQYVADHLQTQGVKKTAAQKALDALAEGQEITAKDFGKQRLYIARQDRFEIPSEQELAAMESRLKALTSDVESEKAIVGVMENEVKSLHSALTDEQLITRTAELQKQKLAKLRSGAVLVSPEERAKVLAAYLKTVNEWKKRKRMFKDFFNTITEAIDKKTADLMEEMGVETDEDAGVDINEYLGLDQSRARK
eukprot:jgi/Chlat1/2213/Chrsp17S02774